jgi:hypothetical protein
MRSVVDSPIHPLSCPFRRALSFQSIFYTVLPPLDRFINPLTGPLGRAFPFTTYESDGHDRRRQKNQKSLDHHHYVHPFCT